MQKPSVRPGLMSEKMEERESGSRKNVREREREREDIPGAEAEEDDVKALGAQLDQPFHFDDRDRAA